MEVYGKAQPGGMARYSSGLQRNKQPTKATLERINALPDGPEAPETSLAGTSCYSRKGARPDSLSDSLRKCAESPTGCQKSFRRAFKRQLRNRIHLQSFCSRHRQTLERCAVQGDHLLRKTGSGGADHCQRIKVGQRLGWQPAHF